MDTNFQSRAVSLSVLGLIAVTCGIYHGRVGSSDGLDLGSKNGALVVRNSGVKDCHRAVISSEEVLKEFLENPNLIDAELRLEEWVKRSPTAEVECLLQRLACRPDHYEWGRTAELVVSLWIAKDPEKAMAFVVSHRNVLNDSVILFRAGESLALLHPELASKWLKEQKDLTPIECGAAIAGLSSSYPDLAGDLISKSRVCDSMPYPEGPLEMMFNRMQGLGVDYTETCLSKIENEENRSRLYREMAYSNQFTLNEKARIISKCLNEEIRIDSIESVCYSMHEATSSELREFLNLFPKKEAALALVRLAARFPEDPFIARDLSGLERPDRESAIFRYLKSSPGQEERISALSILATDPNEREFYLSKINEDSFWEWIDDSQMQTD